MNKKAPEERNKTKTKFKKKKKRAVEKRGEEDEMNRVSKQ